MKFCTTTNLVKIAFSVIKSLCSFGVRSLELFIGTQNATKVTRIMIIELTPTKKNRAILNLKSMATATLQDCYIKPAKIILQPVSRILYVNKNFRPLLQSLSHVL